MKKRSVLILLTIVMISACVCPILINTTFANTASKNILFTDLNSSHWAYNNIMNLTGRGIINGYEDGSYQPERDVRRGEFLKLVMTALYGGNEYFEINNFNFGHWATPYALEAFQMGYLMDGTTVTNLNDSISRLEMVHILAKICINNRIEKDETIEAISFSDTAELDESSQLYIDFVTQNGLITGYTDGTFKANKTMTRAEVATVMSRFLSLVE